MSTSLLLVQLLNGFQLGVLLFLLSAGLTLVLGIMNFINLAHGSLYMIGAYLAVAAFGWWDSFFLAGVFAVAGTLLAGLLIERSVLSRLYDRDHLYQVLGTFGLILCINEIVRIVWGLSPMFINMPQALSGTVEILGLPYPIYRFAIIGVGLAVALALYLAIHKTRIGMLIRAGASDAMMVSALGVNIKLVNAVVFGVGAALAGLAGLMAAPILSVQPGMGEPILILTLVVIVTGGVGSVRGAFFGALIVGIADTMGRSLIPVFVGGLFELDVAQAAGPALASMLTYILMAVVLALRPQGLFPVKHG
ncbi:MAG: branched-chain amino acid ABC transporter permease [Pseudomonadota bacterium]